MVRDILEKMKNFVSMLNFRYELSEIWDEVKDYIRNEAGAGEIVDILDVKKNVFETCPPNLPSEYCSKDNIEKIFVVKTSTGDVFTIKEGAYGLNFEEPCDYTKYSIYNEKNELIYTSAQEKKDKGK